MIVHYINKNEHRKALQQVTAIDDVAKRHETMLRYAPVFVNKCAPLAMRELRAPEYNDLNIAKLMPAFMNIQTEGDMKVALDYITEHCIKELDTGSKTVHNMAFFFHSKISDPKGMIEFLEDEEAKKSRSEPVRFEVEYALNMCKQREKDLMDRLQKNEDVSKLRPADNSGDKAPSKDEVDRLKAEV